MKRSRNMVKEWFRSLGITLLAVLIVAAILAAGLYQLSDRRFGEVVELEPAARPGRGPSGTAGEGSGQRAREQASAIMPESADPASSRAAVPAAERPDSGESAGAIDATPGEVDRESAEGGTFAPTESMTRVEAPPTPKGIGEQASGRDRDSSTTGGGKKAASSGSKAAVEERRIAEKRWRKTLDDLHRKGLHASGLEAVRRREKAEAELEAIADPAAVPAIWSVFAGKADHHLLIARMLGRIDTVESTKMLAALSVYSPEGKARQAATQALLPRDPGDFAEPLIGLLNNRMNYRPESIDIPGRGRARVLFIEGQRADYRFLYPAPEQAGAPRGTTDVYTPDNPFMTRADRQRAEAFNRAQADMARASVETQLQSDITEVERLNKLIEDINGRAVAVLREVSGREYQVDREAWRRWLAGRLGKPYAPPKSVAKPTIAQIVLPLFRPNFIGIPAPT